MKSLILYGVNGQEEQLKDWSQVNWAEVFKLIRNLQRRIFRARKLSQWKQLRRLQKLLLRSYANLLESVRRITEDNRGKDTPGIDKKLIKTPRLKKIPGLKRILKYRISGVILFLVPIVDINSI